MTSIYILKLEDGKYYIGKSANVERRFFDHMAGTGSSWTRKHRAIEIEKVIPNTSPFDEDKYTKEYMAAYGIDNVRGGSYVTIDLSDEQKGFLTREIWGAQDLCARCGQSGHFIRQCPITPIKIPSSNVSPIELDDVPEPAPVPAPPLEPLPVPPPEPITASIPPTLTIPNPVFVMKNWFDTSFAKIHNEFANPNSDLRTGRFLRNTT
jgi:hypothetical protein